MRPRQAQQLRAAQSSPLPSCGGLLTPPPGPTRGLTPANTPQRFITAIREGRLQDVEQALRGGTVSAISGARTAFVRWLCCSRTTQCANQWADGFCNHACLHMTWGLVKPSCPCAQLLGLLMRVCKCLRALCTACVLCPLLRAQRASPIGQVLDNGSASCAAPGPAVRLQLPVTEVMCGHRCIACTITRS